MLDSMAAVVKFLIISQTLDSIYKKLAVQVLLTVYLAIPAVSQDIKFCAIIAHTYSFVWLQQISQVVLVYPLGHSP